MFSPKPVTCPYQLTLLDVITVNILMLVEEYK
jgi:hypothetical protein